MIFRLYYEVKGGHVHCRLFAGPHDGALGKCGDLCMRTNEFNLFRDAATFMQFRKEVRYEHERRLHQGRGRGI